MVIVNYDKKWPQYFLKIKAELQAARLFAEMEKCKIKFLTI